MSDRVRAAVRDAGLFLRFEWGNELNANLAGTTASARGTDPAYFSRFAMRAQPEPFIAPDPSTQPGGSQGASTWVPPWVHQDTEEECRKKGAPWIWDPAHGGCVLQSDGPGVIGGNWGADPNNPVGGGLLDLFTGGGTQVWRTGAFLILAIVIIAVGLLALTR